MTQRLKLELKPGINTHTVTADGTSEIDQVLVIPDDCEIRDIFLQVGTAGGSLGVYLRPAPNAHPSAEHPIGVTLEAADTETDTHYPGPSFVARGQELHLLSTGGIDTKKTITLQLVPRECLQCED